MLYQMLYTNKKVSIKMHFKACETFLLVESKSVLSDEKLYNF